jgi:hypothetical protein
MRAGKIKWGSVQGGGGGGEPSGRRRLKEEVDMAVRCASMKCKTEEESKVGFKAWGKRECIVDSKKGVHKK